MPRTIAVRLHVLEVRSGLWCVPCALPSGAELVIALGRDPSGLSTFARCTQCGSDQIEDP